MSGTTLPGGRHRRRDEGWRALAHRPPRCAGGRRSPANHHDQLDLPRVIVIVVFSLQLGVT